MAAIGGDIVAGLAGGIRSAIGRATDAARNLAGSVINAAEGILKRKSPSKVFRDIGRDVGKGLVIGLSDSIPTVKNASKALAGATFRSFDGLDFSTATPNLAAATGGSSVPVGGGVNIHNELTVNAADVPAEQVARESFQQLREMERAQRYR
jgi:hypothetical protein